MLLQRVATAATYMPAGQVYLLQQTPQLLFKYAYWLSAVARWMLAGSLPLNPACKLVLCFSICHTCWYLTISVPAVVMPHYRPYLLMWCLNISPAVVAQYRPWLLVWCITTGNAFWCGASLSDMPAGVLPHYRSCLLAWRLIINHAYWCVA